MRRKAVNQSIYVLYNRVRLQYIRKQTTAWRSAALYANITLLLVSFILFIKFTLDGI